MAAATGSNERINQQLILKRHPEGLAGPEDFDIVESPVGEPGDGELLVESHYLSVDAA